MSHRLSVIIPTFNDEAYIRGAIESVDHSAAALANATPDAVEVDLVIVNDASTDGTTEAAAAALDETSESIFRTQLIQHSENKGASASRNRGVRESVGDIICFLDADDIFLEPHLTVCAAVLHQNPTVQCVKTAVRLDDPVHPDWVQSINNSVPFNLGIRRWCHDFVGGFMEDNVFKDYPCEDMMYYWFISDLFRLVNVEQETVHHFRYPGNALDRQWEKFILPKGDGPNVLRPKEKAVAKQVQRISNEKHALLCHIRQSLPALAG